jgi:hypothetical protein
VAAEQVGLGQFGGHPLLPGIDELSVRHHSLDLGDVAWLDGVAENDSHATSCGRRSGKQASRSVGQGLPVQILGERRFFACLAGKRRFN